MVLLLNILAVWEPFCDFYTDHIFGLWSETYSRVTGIFPFSVGEILIIFAIVTLFIDNFAGYDIELFYLIQLF